MTANYTMTPRIEGGTRRQGIIKNGTEGKPLVSVITAVYNGVSTLEETIKSVISQDYPFVEYIVIDGGSIDGTLELLKSYDDQIDYWISESDKGIYDALNKAICLARGEWVYFLGADDKLFDEKVLHRFFSEKHDSKMLYGNVVWGNTKRIYDGEFDKFRFYFQNICQQSIFYHRDLFRFLGNFDLTYPIAADWVFNMKAFGLKESKPFFIDEIVALYSTEGYSTRTVDMVFENDKMALFRRTFGFKDYLYLIFRLRKYYPLLNRSLSILSTDGPIAFSKKVAGLIIRKLVANISKLFRG